MPTLLLATCATQRPSSARPDKDAARRDCNSVNASASVVAVGMGLALVLDGAVLDGAVLDGAVLDGLLPSPSDVPSLPAEESGSGAPSACVGAD